MSHPLTKRAFKAALGIELDSDVAAFFKVTAAAVSQWGDDEPIPELRQLQAAHRRPDLFGTAVAERTTEPGMARAG